MFSTTDTEKKQKLHDKNPYEIGTSCPPPSLLGNSFHRNTLVTTFVCLLPFLKRHHLRLPFMNNINVLLGFGADCSSVEDMVNIWLGKDISYRLCSFWHPVQMNIFSRSTFVYNGSNFQTLVFIHIFQGKPFKRRNHSNNIYRPLP